MTLPTNNCGKTKNMMHSSPWSFQGQALSANNEAREKRIWTWWSFLVSFSQIIIMNPLQIRVNWIQHPGWELGVLCLSLFSFQPKTVSGKSYLGVKLAKHHQGPATPSSFAATRLVCADVVATPDVWPVLGDAKRNANADAFLVWPGLYKVLHFEQR